MAIPEHGWDDPETIVEGCIAAQMRLMSGYGGATTTNMQKLEEAKEPKHAAISLAGEPTLYPYLSELVETFHKRGMTTFVVTNGTHPEMIARIRPTQLYISLDAPDQETYKSVCNPVRDTWNDINESLEILRTKDIRTAIRITLVDGINLKGPEKYARLIEKGEPDYVEVKAYMHLGFSRQRLPRTAMPSHKTILEFAGRLAETLGYPIVDDVEISRVVLLSKVNEAKRGCETSRQLNPCRIIS